ncbi:hypothetical protein CI735_09350, partial [Escherichia coli]
PDTGAKSPETAALTGATGHPPSLLSQNPLTATQLPHVPHGGAQWAPRACARERRPACGSRRRTASYRAPRGRLRGTPHRTASAPLSCTIHG